MCLRSRRVSLLSARGVLVLILGCAAALGLAFPLWRLNRRSAASKAEVEFPQFQQRLITFTERESSGRREPFLDLLAADTMAAAGDAEPKRLVGDRLLLTSLGVGVASLGVLLWLVIARPGFLGYGAALLWAGPPKGVAPLYDLRVTPGDATVRRNADELVTAQPVGIQNGQSSDLRAL